MTTDDDAANRDRATRRAMLLRRHRAYLELNHKAKKATRARIAKRLRGQL